MPFVLRQGDPVFHGDREVGTVVEGAAGLTIEGRPAAREGDRVTCADHGTERIDEGLDALRSDGARIAVDGARTTCGARVRATATRTRTGD